MKHVLILGCGRSGTSIFGEFFQQVTSYRYYSEPPFDELLHLDFSQPIAIKVPRESTKIESAPGLSFPIQFLRKSFPEPHEIFWQIRHPLDTICSLRIGIAQNWGHHPKPPDWRNWLQRPLLDRCAHHWNYINSIGYEQVHSFATITRFEDMIRNPKHFAWEIGNRLGIDVAKESDAIDSWSKRVQNTNNEDFVEAECSKPYSRPDHKVRVERWRENLSLQEVESLKPLVEETAGKFGYTLV